jgi:hypothetical protein
MLLSQPRTRTDLPHGTFLKTERGYFFVQDSTRRYRFSTLRVLESWSPQRIVNASEEEPAVKKLKVAAKMKFRNGSLLYSQANGKMYLVSENKLRHIVNPDVLSDLNLKRSEAVWVSLAETQLHEEGEPLS